MPTDSSDQDQYYRQNVFGISAVEFIWGLGLPVVVESTFLQLFVKSLGGTGLALGMIPVFFFIGISVFALLASYMTEGLRFKRRAVIVLHLISGVALLLFGGLLALMGAGPHVLYVFFGCYAIFSVCVGMTLPVWLNYLVKIFSEERSVPGLAAMMIAQNVAKLISSLAILKVVERHAFDLGAAAMIFLTVGGLFVLGSLFFLFTRENAEASLDPGHSRPPFKAFVQSTVRHMRSNRNFLCFLGSDLELHIVVTVISFYAAYATEFAGISPAVAAGLFVGLIYTGAIGANFFLGTLGWFSLKHKTLISKSGAIAAVILLCVANTPLYFYLASFLLGASRGTRMIVFAPAVKKLSGLADATPYFAVAPVLTLPVVTGLPLACGFFLDRMAGLGADAYRIVFLAAAVLLGLTFFCAWRTDFSPEVATASGLTVAAGEDKESS
ncbi:MAG: MFS transporter [Desulfobacterales bacterium]|nr:MFS transporter [Desulfobacterales bacterium]MDJ0882546.1 MFS transporter [Desulfobacterales bacterium]